MSQNGVLAGKRQRPTTAFLVLQRNQRSAAAIAAALRSRFGGGGQQVVIHTAAASGAELADPTGSDRLRRWWDAQRTGVPLSATVVIALDDERGGTARVGGHRADDPAYEVPTGNVDELADAVAARTLTCANSEPTAAGEGRARGLAPKLLLTGALVAGGWVLSTALQPGSASAAALPATTHANPHHAQAHRHQQPRDTTHRERSRHAIVSGEPRAAVPHRHQTVYYGLTHRSPAVAPRPRLTRRLLTVLPPTETTKAQFPGSERLQSHLRHQHLSVNRFGSAPSIRYPWSHALARALQATAPPTVVAVPRGATRQLVEFVPAPLTAHPHEQRYTTPDDDYSTPSAGSDTYSPDYSGDYSGDYSVPSGGGDVTDVDGGTSPDSDGIAGELPRSAMPGGPVAPPTADTGGSVAPGTASVAPTLPSDGQAPSAPQAPPPSPAWGVTGGGYSDALVGGKVGYYQGTDDKGEAWHEISLNPGIGTPGLLGSFVRGDGAAPAPGVNLNGQAGYSVAGAGATVGTTLGMDKGHLGLSGTLSTTGPLGAGMSSSTPTFHFDGTPPGPASTSGGWMPGLNGIKDGSGFLRGPLLNGVTEKPWSTDNISANAGAGLTVRWNNHGMVDAGLPGPKDLDHQILDPVGRYGLENPSVPGGTIIGAAAYGGEAFEHSGLPQKISDYVQGRIAAATDPSTPQGAVGYTLEKSFDAAAQALSGINPAEVAMQPTPIGQLADAGEQFAKNLANEPASMNPFSPPATPIGRALDYAEPGTDATNQALLDGTAPTTDPLDYAEPDTNATNQALLNDTGTINGVVTDPLDYAEPDTDATNQALLDGTAPTTDPLDYAEPDTDATNQALLDGTGDNTGISANQLDYAEPDTDATNQALIDGSDTTDTGNAMDYAEPDTDATNENLAEDESTDTGDSMDYAEPDTDSTNEDLTNDTDSDTLDYAEPDTDATNDALTDGSDDTDSEDATSGDAMDYAEPDTDSTNEDLTNDTDSDTLDYAEPDTDATNDALTDGSDDTDSEDATSEDATSEDATSDDATSEGSSDVDSEDSDSSADSSAMDTDDSSDESVSDDTDDSSDESVSDDSDDSSDESVSDDSDDSSDESVSDDSDDSGSDDSVSDDSGSDDSDSGASDDAGDSGD